MRILKWSKDGGPESSVFGLFIIEIKSLFSVVLLKFVGKSRDAYHTHAFNSWNLVLKGGLSETVLDKFYGAYLKLKYIYNPKFRFIYTPRERLHKVDSKGTTWVLSFRGPWADKWTEYHPTTGKTIYLTHGRKVVND